MQFTSPKQQIEYEIVTKAKPKTKNMSSSIEDQTYNSNPKAMTSTQHPKERKYFFY